MTFSVKRFGFVAGVFFLAVCIGNAAPKTAKQKVPAPQRVAEIQAALKAHGYAPGDTWAETQEACRGIADSMEWQTDHAPDARVLILIGLGNKHSDPAVALERGNYLDKAQRKEAKRTGRIH